jgi:hypothetical protein
MIITTITSLQAATERPTFTRSQPGIVNIIPITLFSCMSQLWGTRNILLYFIHSTLCFIHFGFIEKKVNILNTFISLVYCFSIKARQCGCIRDVMLQLLLFVYYYMHFFFTFSTLIYRTSHLKERPTEKKAETRNRGYVGIATHSNRHIILLFQYTIHSVGEMRI